MSISDRENEPPEGVGSWKPPTAAELARLLPQYRIEALIGQGETGAIYCGEQPELGRPVTLKLLPAGNPGDARFTARFQREARTLAQLQHPGIVSIYDFGRTSAGHLYLVTESVKGTDLGRILRGPGLKPGRALELIGEICEALHYAHGQGVIHYNLRPANILIMADGHVKLADFGLARSLQEGRNATAADRPASANQPGDSAVPPTPTGGPADQREDIYSLGLILYAMLTGEHPHGPIGPPSLRAPVDVRLDEVVLKALRRQPGRGYEHAGEMKTELDRIRTTPLPRRKLRSSRRSILVGYAFGASILALVACGVWWKRGSASGPVLSSSTPSGPTAAGRWEGQAGGGEVARLIRVDLQPTPGGKWSGTLDIPADRRFGSPIVGEYIDSRDVFFHATNAAGEFHFTGRLAADGSRIAGNYKHGALSTFFNLRRRPAGKAGMEAAPNRWILESSPITAYDLLLDPEGGREAKACASLKCLVGKDQPHGRLYGTLAQTFQANPFHGQPLRLSGWVRSKALKWAKLSLIILDSGGNELFFKRMEGLAIKGDTGWNPYEVVAPDVSKSAEFITFQVEMDGEGQLWADDFKLEVIAKDAASPENKK